MTFSMRALRTLFAISVFGALTTGFAITGKYFVDSWLSQPNSKPTPPDSSDISLANAMRLCTSFDAAGNLSEPCKVSGWDASVEVSLDTNAREAQKMCVGVLKMLNESKATFNGWKLKIYSPFSNGKTIAVCDLPFGIPSIPAQMPPSTTPKHSK